MKPIIGILGGMGPRATVQFEQVLLQRFSGGDQSIPTIITINDGTIPDRTSFLLRGGQDPIPAMQRNLRSLEALGAAIICIPCNTACVPAILYRLRPKQSCILDLPEVVGQYLLDQGFQKVYLLATEGTIMHGVYQQVCRKNNISCVVPPTKIQRLVMAVIVAVKQGDMSRATTLARQVSFDISKTDCDGVILGCTELPLVGVSLIPPSCQAIDTLEILADTCAQQVQSIEMKGKHYDSRPIYA